METILHPHDVYDALGFSEVTTTEVNMMIHSSSVTEGKCGYSNEQKGVYLIFIENTRILLPSTFNERTDKKRHVCTGNQAHEQDGFTSAVLQPFSYRSSLHTSFSSVNDI